ncbi:hypothetical protein rsdtw13_16110 [Clostridium sp. TW13]|uniref:Uncharacterized protein n=1 Tax=Inconstantimicrobium mannanitabidum TaxID=1604901 RepID=A0ACB5RAY3_9CLOT|nr:hypothetical protein rsdtw13_16110 [Clostridium sp. TW13]
MFYYHESIIAQIVNVILFYELNILQTVDLILIHFIILENIAKLVYNIDI